MYPRVIACFACRQNASRSHRRSTTSSTPFKERWFALRVAMVSGRCASRTASRSSPGMSQSAGISSAASEVSPWSSGWFATLEGTSKTWHSCDLRLGEGGLGRRRGALERVGKVDLEGRSLPGLAVDLHPAPMSFDHLAHQVEPDPGADDIVQFGVVDPVELLEQPATRRRRNADSMVLDDQADAAVRTISGDLDLGRPGAELDRILQQVVDGRGEPLRVADDGQRRGREVDVDGALLEYQLRANTLHRVRDDGSQVDLRHLLFHGAVLQAGQEEHPLDLSSHLARFIHQRADRMLRRRRNLAERSVLEQRRVAPNHGQRCAKLVRGDLHELASRALELDQRLGASPFALQGRPGVDGNRRLRRNELEPAELLWPQPARSPPVQPDEANESLPGAHG